MISLIFQPYTKTPIEVKLTHVTNYTWPNPMIRKQEISLLKGKATQYSGFYTSDKVLIIDGSTEDKSLYINIMKEYLVSPPDKALAPDEFLDAREDSLWVYVDEKNYVMRWASEPTFTEKQVNSGLIFDYQLKFKLIEEVEEEHERA